MQVARIGLLECLLNTVKQEGLLGLYKGVYYPLLTNPVVTALNFGVYELYKKFKCQRELSFTGGLEAGAVSGLVGSVVVSPVEMVKCTMQTSGNSFRNSKECLLYILRNQGINGLYRGMFSTVVREIPSIAGQFAAYEYLKSFFLRLSNSEKLSISQVSVAGGLAGMLCWFVSYPQDIIKTRLQVDLSYKKQSRLDGGFSSCVRDIYRRDGTMGFFRGLTPCLIRAYVANAIGFYIYEEVKSAIRQER